MFGEPRVGNQAFADYFQSVVPANRIINQGEEYWIHHLQFTLQLTLCLIFLRDYWILPIHPLKVFNSFCLPLKSIVWYNNGDFTVCSSTDGEDPNVCIHFK
jgi:hypothetical protein